MSAQNQLWALIDSMAASGTRNLSEIEAQVKLFLDNGADPNLPRTTDPAAPTPLSYVIEQALLDPYGYITIADTIIAHEKFAILCERAASQAKIENIAKAINAAVTQPMLKIEIILGYINAICTNSVSKWATSSIVIDNATMTVMQRGTIFLRAVLPALQQLVTKSVQADRTYKIIQVLANHGVNLNWAIKSQAPDNITPFSILVENNSPVVEKLKKENWFDQSRAFKLALDAQPMQTKVIAAICQMSNTKFNPSQELRNYAWQKVDETQSAFLVQALILCDIFPEKIPTTHPETFDTIIEHMPERLWSTGNQQFENFLKQLEEITKLKLKNYPNESLQLNSFAAVARCAIERKKCIKAVLLLQKHFRFSGPDEEYELIVKSINQEMYDVAQALMANKSRYNYTLLYFGERELFNNIIEAHKLKGTNKYSIEKMRCLFQLFNRCFNIDNQGKNKPDDFVADDVSAQAKEVIKIIIAEDDQDLLAVFHQQPFNSLSCFAFCEAIAQDKIKSALYLAGCVSDNKLYRAQENYFETIKLIIENKSLLMLQTRTGVLFYNMLADPYEDLGDGSTPLSLIIKNAQANKLEWEIATIVGRVPNTDFLTFLSGVTPAILEAVKRNNLNVLKNILQHPKQTFNRIYQYADRPKNYFDNITKALQYAIDNNQTEIAGFLAEYCAPEITAENFTTSPFYLAFMKRDVPGNGCLSIITNFKRFQTNMFKHFQIAVSIGEFDAARYLLENLPYPYCDFKDMKYRADAIVIMKDAITKAIDMCDFEFANAIMRKYNFGSEMLWSSNLSDLVEFAEFINNFSCIDEFLTEYKSHPDRVNADKIADGVLLLIEQQQFPLANKILAQFAIDRDIESKIPMCALPMGGSNHLDLNTLLNIFPTLIANKQFTILEFIFKNQLVNIHTALGKAKEKPFLSYLVEHVQPGDTQCKVIEMLLSNLQNPTKDDDETLLQAMNNAVTTNQKEIALALATKFSGNSWDPNTVAWLLKPTLRIADNNKYVELANVLVQRGAVREKTDANVDVDPNAQVQAMPNQNITSITNANTTGSATASMSSMMTSSLSGLLNLGRWGQTSATQSAEVSLDKEFTTIGENGQNSDDTQHQDGVELKPVKTQRNNN